MPSKRKRKTRQEKQKKREGEKAKILLSAHAPTFRANIFHMEL